MLKQLRNICLTVLASQGIAFGAMAMDRHVLVEATHAQFCGLVNHVLLSVLPTDPLYRFKDFLAQIRARCQGSNIQLSFVRNFEGYTFINAANNRFMGTTSEINSPILVSNDILNGHEFAPTPMKPINLILQTLMHEYANKLKDYDQGSKDLVAREFAKYYFPFEQEFAEEGLKIHWLSLPVQRIDKDFSIVPKNRPQPSYIFVAGNSDGYVDLTRRVSEEVAEFSPGLRSTWTESNRMALYFFTSLSKRLPQLMEGLTAQLNSSTIKEQLRADARRKGIPESQIGEINVDDLVSQFADGFKTFGNILANLDSEEMRLFELNRVRILSISETQRELIVTASYALNRSKVDELNRKQKELGANFTVDQEGGIGIKRIIQVPLILRMKLNNPSAAVGRLTLDSLNIDLRPELKVDRVAKVGQISRSGSLIKTLKVKLDLGEVPKVAHLRLSGGPSSLFIAARIIQEERKGLYSFEFELPDDLSEKEFAMIAESIVLDQSRSYMLDRVVQVNEGRPRSSRANEVKIITPGVLVRDLNNNVTVAPVFHPLMPVLLMNKNWHNFMTKGGYRDEMENSKWINMDNFELRFGLSSGQRIRQIRLQMSYDVLVGKPDEKDLPGSFFGQVEVDGQIIPVWSQVSHKHQDQHYQQIVFEGSDIQIRESDGMMVVTAKRKLPFIPLSIPVDKGLGYGPPMVRPLKIDVVLDDGQLTTVSYQFPEIKELDCEDLLKGMKFDFRR